MALARALKQAAGFRKSTSRGCDPLEEGMTRPSAKGKTGEGVQAKVVQHSLDKDADSAVKKYSGPNYSQKNSSGAKGSKIKLIV